VFGSIESQVGLDALVQVPFFAADTNEDGAVGEGDSLLELFNVNVDLSGRPPFGIGDSSVAADGVVDGFNGLHLSTTPFEFERPARVRGHAVQRPRRCCGI